MKFLTLVILLLTSVLGWAVGLDFNATSTNNAVVAWNPYTNAVVLRYCLYWTDSSNTSVQYTTTNWNQFGDVSSSRTNTSIAMVPTNALITLQVTIAGGRKTVPTTPQTNNAIPLQLTNYPSGP